DALHHFDVVAGGVFWRQQAEALSTSAGDGINMTFVGFAGGIDFDLCPLARLHLAQLCLLEVCRDPDVLFIERDDHHHHLPGLHVLTDLHSAIADRSADWRNHFGVLEIQFRLI